jgi:Flp pilus assembly protein TadG
MSESSRLQRGRTAVFHHEVRRVNVSLLGAARSKQKGQTLVLVGIIVGLGVLFGFVALAVDGGSALTQRRNMQNSADSAALGIVQSLGASIVFSNGVGTYLMYNSSVTQRADELFAGNRQGTTGSPTYNSTIEYGRYVQASASYVYSTVATLGAGGWTYTGVAPGALVPNWVDAVRVNAGIDNPTTFARAIGITYVPVKAKAAAALQGSPDYVPSGPTWPMTRCAYPNPTPDPSEGICNPYLFWSSNINEPNCRSQGNFNNMMQLGGHQGQSYEGAHLQLLTQHDERSPLTDYSTRMSTQCGSFLWFPGGNCGNLSVTGHGNVCCSGSTNVGEVDVPDFIYNEFEGRISLTATEWLDENGNMYDWRSADARSRNMQGDWLEVYNGGDWGSNVQTSIRDLIAEKGTSDPLSSTYGLHIDKVMYLYDSEEVYDYPPGCNPNQGCTQKIWMPARNNQQPQRVHMAQSFIFKFYANLASPGGGRVYPPPDICPGAAGINVGSSEVYGVFAGAVLNNPPPNPGPHGLYNYVGFIDAGP